jgi:hypothetical protein
MTRSHETTIISMSELWVERLNHRLPVFVFQLKPWQVISTSPEELRSDIIEFLFSPTHLKRVKEMLCSYLCLLQWRLTKSERRVVCVSLKTVFSGTFTLISSRSVVSEMTMGNEGHRTAATGKGFRRKFHASISKSPSFHTFSRANHIRAWLGTIFLHQSLLSTSQFSPAPTIYI